MKAADVSAFPTVLLPEAEMGRRAVAMLRKLIAEPLTAQPPEVVPCGWWVEVNSGRTQCGS